MARNGVIGRDGDLPWRIPADLRYFKAITMGKPLIMGRRTFESIGRPLPGRTNIVVTRHDRIKPEDIVVAHDMEAACRIAGDVAQRDGITEIMVIGGGEIYALALPMADRIYLTEVQREITGDVKFPALDCADWCETSRDAFAADGDTPGYDFVTLARANVA